MSQALIPDLGLLQERLGLRFRASGLLAQALVHPSYLNENPDFALPSYERLEFLGDAVLGLLVGEWLYRRFPDLPEGPLTQLRAAVVQRRALARWAQDWGLGAMLLMGRGEERGGGRERARNLAAALEAVIGAAYLDQGLEGVRPLVERQAEQVLAGKSWEAVVGDPKSLLQERLQAERHVAPTYEVVREEGLPHARRYVVGVSGAGEHLGQGEGSSKRSAEEAAAREALRRLEALPFKPQGVS